MESFIIRVYRRSRPRCEEIAGLVETVGTERKMAFHTFSGLVNALRNVILPVDNSERDEARSDASGFTDKNAQVKFIQNTVGAGRHDIGECDAFPELRTQSSKNK